jgi:hypothetical protein
MTLKDGRVIEERQPHIRGGAHEAADARDIEAKFHGNCDTADGRGSRHGGFSIPCRDFFDGAVDLAPLRG